MKKMLRFLGIVVAGLFVVSFPRNASAISNNCKNASLYETSFSIAPTSGLANTEIQLEMKFRWTGFAYQACLNTKLDFDLSWAIPGTSYGEDIEEIPIGIVGESWVTKTVKVSINSLPGITPGATTTGQGKVSFGMMVEDNDTTGLGDNLFDPIWKTYTVSVGNRICAFIAPDSKYQCITGSEVTADCSTRSECNGKTCTKIDSSLCGSLAKIWACVADNNIYACSSGNKSDLSDTPSCMGKTPIQIDPSKCSQSAGGGTGTGTGTGEATATKSYTFNITNPLAGGPNDLFDIINIVTQWIMYISIPLAVLWIMYAGFLMLTAGPKPENFNKGRDILKYTILGLAIIFIGKGFVSLIISVIQLGGTGTSTTQTQTSNPNQNTTTQSGTTESAGSLPSGTATIIYGCTDQGYCVSSDDPNIYKNYRQLSTDSSCSNACNSGGPDGSIGSLCQKTGDCQSGYECKNNMCQQTSGNFINDPCVKNNNCRNGATCNVANFQVKDGVKLGTCE